GQAQVSKLYLTMGPGELERTRDRMHVVVSIGQGFGLVMAGRNRRCKSKLNGSAGSDSHAAAQAKDGIEYGTRSSGKFPARVQEGWICDSATASEKTGTVRFVFYAADCLSIHGENVQRPERTFGGGSRSSPAQQRGLGFEKLRLQKEFAEDRMS